VVWLNEPATVSSHDVQRRVSEQCSEKGVRVELLSFPDGSLSLFKVQGNTPAIVVSPALPPGDIPSSRLIVASDGPVNISSHDSLDLREYGSPAELAMALIGALERAHFVPLAGDEAYTPEEEERLRQALDDLGYL